MEKGKKPSRIDLKQEQPERRREQPEKPEPDDSSELTIHELEPRVTPRPIGTFF